MASRTEAPVVSRWRGAPAATSSANAHSWAVAVVIGVSATVVTELATRGILSACAALRRRHKARVNPPPPVVTMVNGVIRVNDEVIRPDAATVAAESKRAVDNNTRIANRHVKRAKQEHCFSLMQMPTAMSLGWLVRRGGTHYPTSWGNQLTGRAVDVWCLANIGLCVNDAVTFERRRQDLLRRSRIRFARLEEAANIAPAGGVAGDVANSKRSTANIASSGGVAGDVADSKRSAVAEPSTTRVSQSVAGGPANPGGARDVADSKRAPSVEPPATHVPHSGSAVLDDIAESNRLPVVESPANRLSRSIAGVPHEALETTVPQSAADLVHSDREARDAATAGAPVSGSVPPASLPLAL
jgi:hypothetical protein